MAGRRIDFITVVLVVWAAAVVVGLVSAVDALNRGTQGALIALLVGYGGVALMTRSTVDSAIAKTSRVEPIFRIVLATGMTIAAIGILSGELMLRLDPPDHGRPPSHLSYQFVVGVVGGIATAAGLTVAGARGVIITRVVFAACAGIAAWWLAFG